MSGKYVVRVDVQGDGDRQKAVLRRWDVATGKALEPITLLSGPALGVVVAADARTVLVLQSIYELSPPVGHNAWSAFSTETGKPLGKVPYPPGMSSVTAVGDRAFFIVLDMAPEGDFTGRMARVLQAVELKTGKLLWQRPVSGGRVSPSSGALGPVW